MWSSLRSFTDAIADGVREFSEQLDTETEQVRHDINTNLKTTNNALGEAMSKADFHNLADNMTARTQTLASRIEQTIASSSAEGVMQTVEGVLNKAEHSASRAFATTVRARPSTGLQMTCAPHPLLVWDPQPHVPPRLPLAGRTAAQCAALGRRTRRRQRCGCIEATLCRGADWRHWRAAPRGARARDGGRSKELHLPADGRCLV